MPDFPIKRLEYPVYRGKNPYAVFTGINGLHYSDTFENPTCSWCRAFPQLMYPQTQCKKKLEIFQTIISSIHLIYVYKYIHTTFVGNRKKIKYRNQT